jgi:acyl-CoA synthetase (AMP-forming)/AMP-acid ligase II
VETAWRSSCRRPRTAAIFFGVWKLGAILLSMSVLYGDESIRHRLDDSGAKLVVTDAVNAGRFGAAATGLLLVDEETFVGASSDVAVSRFGPRFRGFAGMASARDVVCPPVRTKVSGFGDDQLRGRARAERLAASSMLPGQTTGGGAEKVVSNAAQSQSERWDWSKVPTWQSD